MKEKTISANCWMRLGFGLEAGAIMAWACVPLAHLVKHIFGLPDTLHPNTYFSILLLALYTLAVTAIGFGCGVFIRRLTTGNPNSTTV